MALCIVTTIAKAQDKIIKRNGDTLKVTITKSTPDLVEFTYPNESAINSEYKNSLAKIIYSSGREENCAGAKKLVTINSAKDWEKVEITTNEEDVKGLNQTWKCLQVHPAGVDMVRVWVIKMQEKIYRSMLQN